MHVQMEGRQADGGVRRSQAAKRPRWHGSRHAGVEFLAQQPFRAAERAIPKNGK